MAARILPQRERGEFQVAAAPDRDLREARLQIRGDEADEPGVVQHTAKFGEGARHVVRKEM